jgi:DNA polymerase-3 subunit epsilon
LRTRFLDLAVVLPALFPDRANITLDDWILDFSLPPIGRHHAIADAYASAQLWLLALEQAARVGLRTVADLVALERAQRWLGKRH